MTRECQVRICEGLGVKFPGPTRRVSRASPVQTAMRNCTRDEGRSSEAGSQVLASNRCKLLSSERWSIACAMQHGVLLWVKSVGSTRPTSSRHVRCASDSNRIAALQRFDEEAE